jgi:hypothetical protein
VLVCRLEAKISPANSGEDKKNSHPKQQRLRKKDQHSQQLHRTETKSNTENTITENDSAEDVPKSDKKSDGPKRNSPSTSAAAPPAKNESGLYFDSFEDASGRVQGLNWPPRLDVTLPAGPAARRAIVKELYAAMTDMSNVQDKNGNVFKKRWGRDQDSPPENAFTAWELERKCWELLVSGTDMLELAENHYLQ